jgi:8-oxo-dGTP pyrophosphatase MutT (NUDIX family)
MNEIPKVFAYITRERNGILELLIHEHRDHPDAGLQIPAGTVDPGEDLEAALWREVEEESGLTQAAGLTLVRHLTSYRFWAEWSQHWHHRHVYHLAAPPDLPNTWAHTVSDGTFDKGLVFVYRWLPVAEAAARLAGQQGECLPLLGDQANPLPLKSRTQPKP